MILKLEGGGNDEKRCLDGGPWFSDHRRNHSSSCSCKNMRALLTFV